MKFIQSRQHWLGQRPEHWDEGRVGHLCKILTGGTPNRDNTEYWEHGTLPWMASGEVAKKFVTETESRITELAVRESNAKLLPPNSVMLALNGQGKTKGTAAVLKIRAACNQSLAAIVCDPKRLHYQYLFWHLESRYSDLRGLVGEERDGLNLTHVREIPVYLPPVDEQREIADFLDRETARFAELVECKSSLLRQLEDKEQSLIASTVCRGLNGSARTRATGIPWIGDVPEHWELLHLRRVVKKFVDYRGRTPEKVLEGVPLVTAVNIKNGRIDMSLGQEFMPEADYDDWMVRGLPERGDLLVTTEAPLGEVAQIEDTRVALAQRIILLKVNKQKITNEYLKYFFRSGAGQGELLTRASGSTALGIKASRFKGIAVVVPPLSEQCAIVEYLDRETSRLTQLKAAVEASLPKLAEYRSALISAAVTGQIDVRNYRPQEAAVLCQ
jgi:type I restriction enzyme S subunit